MASEWELEITPKCWSLTRNEWELVGLTITANRWFPSRKSPPSGEIVERCLQLEATRASIHRCVGRGAISEVLLRHGTESWSQPQCPNKEAGDATSASPHCCSDLGRLSLEGRKYSVISWEKWLFLYLSLGILRREIHTFYAVPVVVSFFPEDPLLCPV